MKKMFILESECMFLISESECMFLISELQCMFLISELECMFISELQCMFISELQCMFISELECMFISEFMSLNRHYFEWKFLIEIEIQQKVILLMLFRNWFLFRWQSHEVDLMKEICLSNKINFLFFNLQ